jgi:hypothetical protein
VNIKRQAIGILNVPPAVLTLSATNTGVTINAGAYLEPLGPVTVDTNGLAVSVIGDGIGGITRASVLNILQGAGVSAPIVPPIIPQIHPAADPLAGLSTPPQGTDQGTIPTVTSGTMTLQPGYYRDGITVNGTGTVQFQPGVYVLDGAGLQVSGAASLQGSGVLLYITALGQLSLSGTGHVTLSPDISVGATYCDVVIMQDQVPGVNKQPVIQGSGQFLITGVIYLPNADLTVSGLSDQIGSQIIANTVTVTGNGIVSLNYNYANWPPSEQPMPYLAQ